MIMEAARQPAIPKSSSFGLDMVQLSLHSQQQQQLLHASMLAQHQQQQQQSQIITHSIASASSHLPLVLLPVGQSKEGATVPTLLSSTSVLTAGGTIALPSLLLVSNTPNYSSQTTIGRPALRTGKWIPAEEEYARLLIELFEKGQVTDCENGSTLRSYLSSKLFCPAMRISKKFAGKGIGKMMYLSKLNIGVTISLEQRRINEAKLKNAEYKFLQAIMPSSKSLIPLPGCTNPSSTSLPWSFSEQQQHITDPTQNASNEDQNVNRTTCDNRSTASSTVIVSNVSTESTLPSKTPPTEFIDVPVKSTAHISHHFELDDNTKQLQESYHAVTGGKKFFDVKPSLNEDNLAYNKNSTDIEQTGVHVSTKKLETKPELAPVDPTGTRGTIISDFSLDKTNARIHTHFKSLPPRNDELEDVTAMDPLAMITEAFKTYSTSMIFDTATAPIPYHIRATTSGSFDIDGTMKIVSEHMYGETTIKKSERSERERTTKSVAVIVGNGSLALSPSSNSVVYLNRRSTDDTNNTKVTTEVISGIDLSYLGGKLEEESASEFDESDDQYSSCGSSTFLDSDDDDEDDHEDDGYCSANDVSVKDRVEHIATLKQQTKRVKFESKNRKAKRIKL